MKKKKNGFKRFLRKIGNFFVNLKNNFFRLKKKVRYIIYVWLIVIVVLLVLVGCSNHNAKNVEAHQKIEAELRNATLTYVSRNEIYPNVSNKWKVTIDQLKELKYITDSEITDKTCKGYSIIYYNENINDYVEQDDVLMTLYTNKEITDFIKMQLKKGNSWDIEYLNLDGTDGYEYTYSYSKNKLYVMIPDESSVNEASRKIHENFEK